MILFNKKKGGGIFPFPYNKNRLLKYKKEGVLIFQEVVFKREIFLKPK